ncbi:unnamed protein product [Fraxinus pennsylvanica]|uniref:Uncharacterized protein n=1 Tax=Fraxinus pennsylvanica TaxID=56036 RepID=A0AAD2DLN5_9LAMI|nr:unnamed protein product [Fraxinus pennsylvanica]
MEIPSKDAVKNKKSPLSSSRSSIISLSSSGISNCDSFYSDESDLDGWDIEGNIRKKQRIETVLPVSFLDPLTPEERSSIQKEIATSSTIGNNNDSFLGLSNVPIVVKQESFKNSDNACKDKAVSAPAVRSCKQFWKAGDYEGKKDNDSSSRMGN